MTYLEAVNNVLKRLREDVVLSVDENEYSSQIGVMVNDAKIFVEDNYQWSALKTTQSVDTVANVKDVSLVGVTPRSEIVDVADITNNRFLTYATSAQVRRNRINATNNSAPAYYTFNGIDSNGDILLEMYPTPNSILSLEVTVVKRPPDLTADADIITVPAYPVTQLAYAMAIQERGEAGGMSSTQQYTIAQRALQDAISLDALKHPEETVWNVY
jgi:hypothetical protein